MTCWYRNGVFAEVQLKRGTHTTNVGLSGGATKRMVKTEGLPTLILRSPEQNCRRCANGKSPRE
jgi:hypothetical protein